jgi:hypothetical protein
MITTAELHSLSEEEGLRFDQTEKDYVILWLLSGLVHSGMTKHGWVFKGGTCRVRGITPDIAGLTSANLNEWNKNAWRDRLGPMLRELPDFDLAWKEWTETFRRIAGSRR